jgi:hypothetical protein
MVRLAISVTFKQELLQLIGWFPILYHTNNVIQNATFHQPEFKSVHISPAAYFDRFVL